MTLTVVIARRSIFRYCFVWILLTGTSAFCQQLPTKIFTIEDGLPTINCTPLLEDHFGFIWFGSSEGLTAFDGNIFTTFGRAQGLLGNIGSAIEDEDGTIWTGGRLGLFKASRSAMFPLHLEFHEVRNKTGQPFSGIQEIVRLSPNVLLVSSEQGVVQISAGVVRSVTLNFTSASLCNSANPDAFGTMLVSGKTGLRLVNSFEAYRGDYIEHPNGDPEIAVSPLSCLPVASARGFASVVLDSLDDLWCLQDRSGIFVLSPDGKKYFPNLYAIKKEDITSIWGEDKSHFWISGKGILVRATVSADRTLPGVITHLESYLSEKTESRPITFSRVFLDHRGNLWSQVDQPGVLRMKLRGFSTFPAATLHSQTIHRVFPEPDGTFWVAAEKLRHFRSAMTDESGPLGSNFMEMEQYTTKHRPYGFVHAGGDAILIYGDSSLLALGNSTKTGRTTVRPVVLLEDSSIRRSDHFPVAEVLACLQDKDGSFWISKNGVGVLRCSLSTDSLRAIELVSVSRGLADNGIRVMTQSADGAIWFGSYSMGLTRYLHGALQTFTMADGLPDNAIRALHESRDGTLWIGTRWGGLAAFRNGTFSSYPSSDLFRSNSVWSIAEDNEGTLWIGTEQGLKCFRPNLGGTEPPVVRHFGMQDGIPPRPVYLVGFDGRKQMYCSQSEGLYTIQSNILARLFPSPSMYLKTVLVNGVDASSRSSFDLAAGENSVSFEYGALDPSGSSATQCSSMLDGLDTSWGAPTYSRSVTYSKLPPGNFTFRLKAIIPGFHPGSDSLTRRYVDASSVEFSFSIAERFYRTWWFLLLAALSVGSGTFGLYRLRVNRLVEIERTRNRIAMDLHDDIGSSLTRISLMTEIARRREMMRGNPPEETLAQIGEAAREIIDALGDIVWSVDPEQDALQSVVRRIVQFGEEICEAAGITFETKISGNFEDRKLSLEQRRELYLLLKEGINNIAKHSAASTATFAIRQSGFGVQIELSDNGKGFVADGSNTGNGLRTMRARAERAGAILELISTPDVGTHIRIQLKTV